MKRRTFVMAALLTACSATPPAADPIAQRKPTYAAPTTTPEDVASVVGSANRFALAMFEQLGRTKGNLVFSPASISLALNMTRAGARGETATQMASALQITLDDARAHRAYGSLLHRWNYGERPYALAVANRLFGERTLAFEPPFLSVTGTLYGAELEPVSFLDAPNAARESINNWIAEQTSDRIQDLLPEGSIDTDSRLVLTNAVYFKGKWKVGFDEDDTHDAAFHAPGGDTQVPMMHLGERLSFAAADGMKLVELPYQGDALALTVIVPDAVDGLADLEAKLSPSTLDGWLAAASSQQVVLSLPRFKIDPPTPIRLKPMLVALGMSDAFDATKADFTGMATMADGRLVIDEAYHKAFVQVNEEGTEAAAASAVVMSYTTAVEGEQHLVADHPFLFLIRDITSGAILFMGRVDRPSA